MFLNCIESFVRQARDRPKAMAIHIPLQEEVTFSELLAQAVRIQTHLLSLRIEPGTHVLLMDDLGSRLYATMTALMSLGATVMAVEPWMPVARIQKTIELAQPKLFIGHMLGFLWGMRVPAVRKIPYWMRISSLNTSLGARRQSDLVIEKVDPHITGLLTFTSGTTGAPKGVVRSQGYLLKQHEVLAKYLESAQFSKPDLCIFANFVMTNLASGRGSILIPSDWKPRCLQAIDDLPEEIQPATLTTGPAFLRKLMKYSRVDQLQSIHVGGALTDCQLFEQGFRQWPQAHWSHIYGGSEVEPVALADARHAVQASKDRGFFQTLYLGKNIPEIKAELGPDGLWVAGPHVCPEYFGNDPENQIHKKKDPSGQIWHFMGDRIQGDSTGWWYQGRTSQELADFLLEQKIYYKLQSSSSFVHKNVLIGEKVTAHAESLLIEFPTLQRVHETRIYRDRRHRARIDRVKTIKKGGAVWLAG